MKEIKDLGFGVIQVNETKPTISKMKSVDNYLCKWQKLKEWLKKYIEYQEALKVKNAKVIGAYMKGNIIDPIRILDKMQELEGEDVKD